MSVFAKLKGDKRADKEALVDLRNLLGPEEYAMRCFEVEHLGKALYSALKYYGKIRATKPWDKLGETERMHWGGIAEVVDESFRNVAWRTRSGEYPSEGWDNADDVEIDDADVATADATTEAAEAEAK